MTDELNLAPSFSSYRDYQAEAHELVKNLIRSSLEKIAAEQVAQRTTDDSADGDTKELVRWPLGADFTVEKGLEAIDKFVKVKGVLQVSLEAIIW